MTGRESLLAAVHAVVGAESPIADATVDRLTVGDRLVLVELAGAGVPPVAGPEGPHAAGVSHRPPGQLDGDPSGRRALDVASWSTGSTGGDGELRRAVGLATLNALSAPLLDWRTGDPFEALAEGVETIATVGLFGPAFRKFGAVEVRVVERRDVEAPETPPGVTVSTFAPGAADRAFDGADVVFVTGSTLLYGGTEAYLDAARDVPDVVLVGATASFLPGPAFDAGATMLAGARVTGAGDIRARIRGGECATDLHDEGLEKVYVTAGEPPTGLDLG